MKDTEQELLKGERREICRLHALRLSTLDRAIAKLDLALYGNGEPEKGILWIAKKNNETLSWIAKVVVGIFILVGSSIIVKVYPEVLHFLSGKP